MFNDLRKSSMDCDGRIHISDAVTFHRAPSQFTLQASIPFVSLCASRSDKFCFCTAQAKGVASCDEKYEQL
jgi:hypothetical protein